MSKQWLCPMNSARPEIWRGRQACVMAGGVLGLSYGGPGKAWKGGTECRISNKECRISKGTQAAFPSKFDIPCSIYCGSVLHCCVGDTKGRSPLPGHRTQWRVASACATSGCREIVECQPPWQTSRARGVAATPREGTGQSRRRVGRGGRSQWRSALPEAGLNGAWRECPDAPARSPQSRIWARDPL
jgi:hypothetical protein